MRDRYEEIRTKKPHHPEDEKEDDCPYRENVLEISSELHMIFSVYSITYLFFMQKSFTTGIITGVVITLVSISTLAHAADGGLFGQILAKILGITPAQVLTYS
jgi:hypothetical protein